LHFCKDNELKTTRQILLFGHSGILNALAPLLRASPLLQVTECHAGDEVAALGAFHPDVVLVDAAQITPEQFSELLEICPTLLSVDPTTYQLTVLSSSNQSHAISETARAIEILSLAIHPA
jgi:hypothetical protein